MLKLQVKHAHYVVIDRHISMVMNVIILVHLKVVVALTAGQIIATNVYKQKLTMKRIEVLVVPASVEGGVIIVNLLAHKRISMSFLNLILYHTMLDVDVVYVQIVDQRSHVQHVLVTVVCAKGFYLQVLLN